MNILFQCLAIFTICTSIFDLYCLSQAAPGSTHYGYYVISYEFVYVGNRHGKKTRKSNAEENTGKYVSLELKFNTLFQFVMPWLSFLCSPCLLQWQSLQPH